MFSTPTYLVLELPRQVGNAVLALRARFDSEMAALPPEITVAGSSGLGVLDEGQAPSAVFTAIESVIAAELPITTAFLSVERFPATHIYWLKPRDRAPFDLLQQRLVTAGIRFKPTSFAYTPHCTIARKQLSQADELALRQLAVPSQDFVLRDLCAYELMGGKAKLVRRFAVRHFGSTA